MGMYTELHYNAELLSSTPLEVLDVLSYMVKAKQDSYRPTIPRHSLFETDRWDYMLVSNSYYFAADTHSTLRYDAIAEAWFICIRCNFKNYCDELRKFCEWIDPYVSANEGEFLGFSRYENSELPDLIFKQGNPPPPGRKLSAPIGPPIKPQPAGGRLFINARLTGCERTILNTGDG
jgi:hypothetical protein